MNLAPTPDSAAAVKARMAEEMKSIWLAFKKSGSELLRNKLIEKYMHLVRYNAERIHVKLPDEVELDDLISVGVFGLIDAIKAFDMSRGVKFETYCAPRIRGAILDELREMDWVPRLVRSRSSKLDGANKQLEVELGRTPTSDELAKHLRVPMDEFNKIAKDASAVGLVSLSHKLFERDSTRDVREIDILEDRRAGNPSETTDRKDILKNLLLGYARADRLIIILYYYEEMTMREIGLTLDLSESRVSQMHSSVLQRLKDRFADHQDQFIALMRNRKEGR